MTDKRRHKSVDIPDCSHVSAYTVVRTVVQYKLQCYFIVPVGKFVQWHTDPINTRRTMTKQWLPNNPDSHARTHARGTGWGWERWAKEAGENGGGKGREGGGGGGGGSETESFQMSCNNVKTRQDRKTVSQEIQLLKTARTAFCW